MITSFDVWAANLPFIEIYGSMGSLSLPDPNTFGGAVKLFSKDEKIWKDIPITRSYTENSRGLGVADMAHGIQTQQAHRANARARGDARLSRVLESGAAYGDQQPL
jgi:hypothetical protein